MKENLSQRDGLDKKENSSAHEYLSNFFCDDQFFFTGLSKKESQDFAGVQSGGVSLEGSSDTPHRKSD